MGQTDGEAVQRSEIQDIKVDMTTIPSEGEVHSLEGKCMLGRQGQGSVEVDELRERGNRRWTEWGWVLKIPYM